MAEQAVVAIVLVVVVAVVFAAKAVRIVPQYQLGLLERLGRYRRTLQPGVNVIAPFVDQVRTLVDTREQELDLPPVEYITADNTRLAVEGRLRYQITDPVKAVYEVASHRQALEQLAATTLRNLLGGKIADQALATSYHQLGEDLRVALASHARVWGIELRGAEITAIELASIKEKGT